MQLAAPVSLLEVDAFRRCLALLAGEPPREPVGLRAHKQAVSAMRAASFGCLDVCLRGSQEAGMRFRQCRWRPLWTTRRRCAAPGSQFAQPPRVVPGAAADP